MADLNPMQGVRKRCALCLQVAPLKLSHVIPRFMIKPLLDAQGKAAALDKRNIDKPKYNLRLSETLLCADCELLFSKNESYLKTIIEGNYQRKPLAGKVHRIAGLDYQKFKLFYLSVLWRAHVSRLEFFKNVALGPYERIIATMLLVNDPGSVSDFPLFLGQLHWQTNPGREIGIITQPVQTRYASATAYRALFGGFDWTIAVTKRPKEPYRQAALQADGSINCLQMNLVGHDLIADHWRAMYLAKQ